MNAWTVAKGILIATAILTAVGWLYAAGVVSVGAVVVSNAVEQSKADAAVAEQQRADERRRYRLSTKKGKSLYEQCRDWRKADADYHLPSTRQGVERYCGELERYLATGI